MTELLDHLGQPESVKELHRQHFSVDLIIEDSEGSDFLREVYGFVMDHVQKHGVSPEPAVLEDEFGYGFSPPQSHIGYLIDRYRERFQRQQINDVGLEVARLLGEDPEKAVQFALASYDTIRAKTTGAKRELTLDDADQVLDDYEERVRTGETRGVTFGFAEMDSVLGGLQKLTFVIGRPKRYKSWLLLKSAVEACQEYGSTVAVFSLEMGHLEMYNRAMCMFSGVPWPDFVHERLSESRIRGMRKKMKEVAERGNFTILSPPRGERNPYQLLRTAQDKGAEAVYIDQLKFLESTRKVNASAGRWQVVEYICEDLKEVSQETPFYVAAQFNREAANLTEMADLSKIGLSDAIGQTADMLLGIHTTKEMKSMDLIEFGTIESRSFQDARWHIKVGLSQDSNFRIGRRSDLDD